MKPVDELRRKALLHDQAAGFLKLEAERHNLEAKRLREDAEFLEKEESQ
jgi:hypothetical protein